MALFPKFSKKRDGVNVVMEQRLLQNVNNLILNSETCTGCGICVESCPEDAIVLGLVGAARRGAINYATPIDVDETKCSVLRCLRDHVPVQCIDSESRQSGAASHY